MAQMDYPFRKPMTTCAVVAKRDALGIRGSMNRINILENPEQYEMMLLRAATVAKRSLKYVGVVDGVKTYELDLSKLPK